MFNSLEINSITSSILRCKQCKSVLFAQNQITQFLAYDPNDFGKLQQYSQHKKFQGQANFLLLTQTYDTYSTFKIDYNKSLRLGYHPFFMMHMLLIECAKCNYHLGYQVETVNQNTIWMQGRTLIDASKCSLMKEGKDQMPKLIKSCRFRLVKKLESVKIEQQQPQKEIKDKIYEKLQRIKLPNKKIPKINNNCKDYQGRDKVTEDLKKRGVSVQSTKGQTTFMQKDQKSSNSNYTLNDLTFKTDQLHHFEENTYRQNQMTESMVSISMEKVERNTKQIHNEKQINLKDCTLINLCQKQREKLNMSLQLWRQRIIDESKTLTAHPIIQKIQQHIWKLDACERHFMKRIIQQQLRMDKLFMTVRQSVLEETKPEEA